MGFRKISNTVEGGRSITGLFAYEVQPLRIDGVPREHDARGCVIDHDVRGMMPRGRQCVHFAPAKVQRSNIVRPPINTEEPSHVLSRAPDNNCIGPAGKAGIAADMIAVTMRMHD
jgi:hypothetical protein